MDYTDENRLLVENIRILCHTNGISLTILENTLGFGNGAIGKWAKSSKRPNLERVIAVASYFGETVDSLRLGNPSMKRDPSPENRSELSEKDIRLLQWFRSLPQGKQKAILDSHDAPEGLV